MALTQVRKLWYVNAPGKMPSLSPTFPLSQSLPIEPVSSISSPLTRGRSPGWPPRNEWRAMAQGLPDFASALSRATGILIIDQMAFIGIHVYTVM